LQNQFKFGSDVVYIWFPLKKPVHFLEPNLKPNFHFPKSTKHGDKFIFVDKQQ